MIDLFFRDLFIGARQHRGGFALGGFQELAVADEIGHLKVWHPGLAGAEEFTWPAQLKVEFGNLEAVGSADHGIEAAFAILGNFSSSHQNAIGFGRAAADASTKLVQLRQSKAPRMLD